MKIRCLAFIIMGFICSTGYSQPNKTKPVSNTNYHPQQPKGMNKYDLTETLGVKKNKSQSQPQSQKSSGNQNNVKPKTVSPKVETPSQKPAQKSNNNPHAKNAVDSHDKYANQEVSYTTGNNKGKTNVKPVPSSKTGKTKLMEEEGIYYRRRH